MQADLAAHATDEDTRHRASRLLGMLTPLAKTFPAEWGFESNALALQIHGGYGYSTEQLPEAWLRDQKLNSIHEGTTGIQALDLLGRKVVADGGAALRILHELVLATVARADRAGVDGAWSARVREAMGEVLDTTAHLGALGLSGDVEGMLLHSTEYLTMLAIVVVAWLWLEEAAIAKEHGPSDFYEGKVCAAQYWIVTELPRARELAALSRSGDDAYARMKDAWF
jgi:butyryl-CoA dehydrogenase